MVSSGAVLYKIVSRYLGVIGKHHGYNMGITLNPLGLAVGQGVSAESWGHGVSAGSWGHVISAESHTLGICHQVLVSGL